MELQLPEGVSLLVRTDFSDDGLWQEVLRSTVDEDDDEPYYPQFTVVDDPRFDGLTVEGLLEVARPDQFYVFVADGRTMTDAEHPLLLVDTGRGTTGHVPGQSVRVTQPVIEIVESNLSIANVDFVDYVRAAEADGVYRGDVGSVNQSRAQHIPISTVREAVARRSDVEVFARLLHDLEAGGFGDVVVVNMYVDMDMYRRNASRQRHVEGWRTEGKEEFLGVIGSMSVGSAAQLSIYGRCAWDVVFDPVTFDPVAAFKQVRTVGPA